MYCRVLSFQLFFPHLIIAVNRNPFGPGGPVCFGVVISHTAITASWDYNGHFIYSFSFQCCWILTELTGWFICKSRYHCYSCATKSCQFALWRCILGLVIKCESAKVRKWTCVNCESVLRKISHFTHRHLQSIFRTFALSVNCASSPTPLHKCTTRPTKPSASCYLVVV